MRVIKVVALQDMGQPVNRHTAENQITGAVIQGMSFALFEDRILDPDDGRDGEPEHGVLQDRRFDGRPGRSCRCCGFRVTTCRVNSLGEPPVIPTPGAIGCAVANAIGTPVRTMPITPARVLEALAGLEGGRA